MVMLVTEEERRAHSSWWRGPEKHGGPHKGREQPGQGGEEGVRGAKHSRQTGTVLAGGPRTHGLSVLFGSNGLISRMATRYRPLSPHCSLNGWHCESPTVWHRVCYRCLLPCISSVPGSRRAMSTVGTLLGAGRAAQKTLPCGLQVSGYGLLHLFLQDSFTADIITLLSCPPSLAAND